MKLFELLWLTESSREDISFFRPTIEITVESGVFRGANIRWPLELTQRAQGGQTIFSYGEKIFFVKLGGMAQWAP